MQTTSHTRKDDTLKIRMDAATLALLEQARGYVGFNKSRFIRESIQEKAQAIIAEHKTTTFSEKDWQIFFDWLDHPPAPTKRMKQAAAKYQEIIDGRKTSIKNAARAKPKPAHKQKHSRAV